MAPAGNGLQRKGDRYVCANTPKVAKQGFEAAPTVAMSSPLGGGGTEQSDVTEEASTNVNVCKEFSS